MSSGQLGAGPADFRIILAQKKDIEELRSRTLDVYVRELIRANQ